MIIPTKSAQSIVEEMSSIIGRNINFISSEGIILASTDSERIGTLHEGALQVIKTQSPLIISKDDQLVGTKEGINLPVYLDKKIFGVIGITGDEEVVLKYGRIIRKMTEILVKEEFIEKREELENRTKQAFAMEWIDGRWNSDKQFVSRAWMLGINVHLPRVAVVLEVVNFHEKFYSQQNKPLSELEDALKLQEEQNNLFKLIQRQIMSEAQDIIIPAGSSKFVLLLTWPERSPETRREQINRKITRIIEQLTKHYDYQFVVGVGSFVSEMHFIERSYKEAEKVFHFAANQASSVIFYEDMRLELLVEEIAKPARDEFVQKVLEWDGLIQCPELIETLKCFFASGQSLQEASNQLFIHKNTLQYRLKRVKEITGYDPRVFAEAVLLYLALYFSELSE